jgi:hypothetical protein
MPTVAVTVAGPSYQIIYDSVANPNGSSDMSVMNNVRGKALFLQSTTASAMPYNTSYETADVGKFYQSDNNNNGDRWGVYTGSATFGKTGTNAAGFECYAYAAGESEVITLPNVTFNSTSALSFWEAYCQYDATTDDKLEVVYSTTCGSTWTSIWEAAGATLSTSAISTSAFAPTSAKYVKKTVPLTTVPAGAMLGFRGTSDYGNNMWVDDVNISPIVSVNDVAGADLALTVYPNPATDASTVSFNLRNNAEVNVTVVDGVGRVVAQVAQGNLTAGNHKFSINSANLAAGVYNVMITTDAGTATQRLSVVR